MTTKTTAYVPVSAEMMGDRLVDVGWWMTYALASPLDRFQMSLERGMSYSWGEIDDRNPAQVAESGVALWDQEIAEIRPDFWWLGEEAEEADDW